MHVSVRRYRDIADTQALIRAIELSFVPHLEKMPGFVGYFAIDTEGGGLTTISVFSTASFAADSNTEASRWLRDIAGRDIEPFETVAGQVAIAVPKIRG